MKILVVQESEKFLICVVMQSPCLASGQRKHELVPAAVL